MSIQDQIKKSLDQHSLNMRTVIAYALFGAIILVFVLFGFPGSRSTIGMGTVAEINGKLISGAELKEETTRLEQFYSQMFGGNFGSQAQRQALQGQAIENLITREILAQEATNAGVLISDKEVRDFIFEIPAFQERGRFDKTRYFQYLEYTKASPKEFETNIRKEAQRMRLMRLFNAVDKKNGMATKAQAEMSSLKFNLQFLKIDREALVKSITVKPGAVQEFLKNPENLKKIEVDYETHKSDLYSAPEQVKAQHLLIKAKEGDAASEKAALTRINDLKTRSTKEDFAALASRFSEDEGSKVKGGDLGFFGRGQMVPPFESAAFSAQKGEIVGPVKTSFGYHLIKILDKKEGKVQTLEDVKAEIAQKLLAEVEVDGKFQKIEEALSKKEGAKVEAEIKGWNLKWEETGDFDLQADSIPKLMGSETLKQAVWTLGQSGQWLDHLVREGSIRYVLKMKEVKKTVTEAKPESALVSSNENTGLFDGWLEQIRAGSKVHRNEDLLRQ